MAATGVTNGPAIGTAGRIARAAGRVWPEGAPDGAPGAAPGVHRLRDLTTGGRAGAAVLALLLVAAPLAAVVRFAGDWVATGDTALMGLRSLDALTARIPLTGQPSTSGFYGGFRRHAFHLGPMHVYLMAPFVRAFGSVPAMLATSVAIVGGSALLAAWAVFRQLGAHAGAVAAAVVGATMFTTGAGSLVLPVSSNIAGYPLLAGAVLVWCLLCGDVRLLPVTVVVLSFAGQAHLSVAPAVAVLGATALVALALAGWRAGAWREPEARRRGLRLVGGSLALGLVLWAPVLYQQAVGDPGNLTAVAEFAGDDQRPTLGPASALRQLAHVLGSPPLLGRTDLRGSDLIGPVSLVTGVTAAGNVVAVVAAGWRWRTVAPRRTRLVVMGGVLAAAGFATGASVPDSIERVRLTFYHWAWPLTLVITLGLVLVVADAVREQAAGRRVPRWVTDGRLAVPGAVAVLAVALAVGPTLDRRSNALNASGAMYPMWVMDGLADQVMAAVDGDEQLVVLTAGGNLFDGAQATLSFRLVERGRDVAFPPGARDFVADEHLADVEAPGPVLVLAIGDDEDTRALMADVPGRDVAWVAPSADVDAATFAGLARQVAEADALVPGPELAAHLAGLGPDERLLTQMALDALAADPAHELLSPAVVDLLIERPLAAPALDPAALRRLRAALPLPELGDDVLPAFTVRLVTGADAAALFRPGGWVERQAEQVMEGHGTFYERP